MLAAGGGGGGHVGGHHVRAFCGRDRTQRARAAVGRQGIPWRRGGGGGGGGTRFGLDDGPLRQGGAAAAAVVILRPALHGLGAENDAEVGALRRGDGHRFQRFWLLLFAELDNRYRGGWGVRR